MTLCSYNCKLQSKQFKSTLQSNSSSLINPISLRSKLPRGKLNLLHCLHTQQELLSSFNQRNGRTNKLILRKLEILLMLLMNLLINLSIKFLFNKRQAYHLNYLQYKFCLIWSSRKHPRAL